MPEDSEMPECSKCGEPFPAARAALGYSYCCGCAPPARQYPVVIQCPKSAYQVLTPGTDPVQIGKKDGGL